jgi:hypothetical protein
VTVRYVRYVRYFLVPIFPYFCGTTNQRAPIEQTRTRGLPLVEHKALLDLSLLSPSC